MSTTCEIEFINENSETLKFYLENDSTTDLIPEIYYQLQKKILLIRVISIEVEKGLICQETSKN